MLSKYLKVRKSPLFEAACMIDLICSCENTIRTRLLMRLVVLEQVVVAQALYLSRQVLVVCLPIFQLQKLAHSLFRSFP